MPPSDHDSKTQHRGPTSLSNKVVDFVLIKVRDQPIDGFLERLENAIGAVLANGATVETTMSSLVLATYGATMNRPASEEKRRILVRQLITKQNDAVAVVEGRQHAWVGSYGPSCHMRYGSILPGLPRSLAVLDELAFGESRLIVDS